MNAVTRAPSASQALRPETFDQLMRFADMAAHSTMVPPGYKGKPADIFLAVQMGSELGLAPMQSLQSIAVINNRPAVFGDALIGLCRQSALCEDIAERLEGEGDNMVAICIAKRRGATASECRFSVADAKKAGLWGKAGPWAQYPKRMLQMRARTALRDAFPDLLRGLVTVEEARDIPASHRDTFSGMTIDGRPQTTSRMLNGDSIPALDTPSQGTREHINAEVPIESAANTSRNRAVVDDLVGRINGAVTQNGLTQVLSDDRVKKQRDWLAAKKPALSIEVEEAIDRAVQRIEAENEMPDDGFPGTLTSEAA